MAGPDQEREMEGRRKRQDKARDRLGTIQKRPGRDGWMDGRIKEEDAGTRTWTDSEIEERRDVNSFFARCGRYA